MSSVAPRRLLLLLCALIVTASAGLGQRSAARGTFGLVEREDHYEIDTGAGLVFRVRRDDHGSNTQSPGDLMSLVYEGVEYQDQKRGSHVTSGFDYLYQGTSEVRVEAAQLGRDVVRVTVTAGELTHYYLARRGQPHVYMATHFAREPDIHGLVRFIVRIPADKLSHGPAASDIRGNTGPIEAKDVFGMADGTTRSKHYSNMRLKDWRHIGATGRGVGVWIVRSNHEGDSGGPFYRSLLNQCGDDQELTYIVNYGQAQTEAFRPGVLNGPYVLVFNEGRAPKVPAMDWVADAGLIGFVGPDGRGAVAAAAITGRATGRDYTVGFANERAQYWAEAKGASGAFVCDGMLPGTYTMQVYRNELSVWRGEVTVRAGERTSLDAIAIIADPNANAALWRIGEWDGAPLELKNGDKLTTMHPSDVRMAPWRGEPFVVGRSHAARDFPACQWQDVNGAQQVRFELTAEQVRDCTLRVGITIAYAGARPKVRVNDWEPGHNEPPSEQPKTRSLTTGSYRGNNTTFVFAIPARALHAGANTLTIFPISGSGGAGFLSAGYAIDAVDLLAADR